MLVRAQGLDRGPAPWCLARAVVPKSTNCAVGTFEQGSCSQRELGTRFGIFDLRVREVVDSATRDSRRQAWRLPNRGLESHGPPRITLLSFRRRWQHGRIDG